ncbi:hypothetical protein M0R45_009220 [Rubus argutus]|uniref:Uncharacterized protein n=1 Tax=Rubus argutus TaxID=59490 RepID=A0AAW1Y492_RUBAR
MPRTNAAAPHLCRHRAQLRRRRLGRASLPVRSRPQVQPCLSLPATNRVHARLNCRTDRALALSPSSRPSSRLQPQASLATPWSMSSTPCPLPSVGVAPSRSLSLL